jgi:hypothetical protein
MAKKPPRPRSERRAQDRRLRQQVRATEMLARTLPGGSRASPIDVATASVVELRARDTPCVQCGGALELTGDRAESTPRGVLRELALVCRLCHAPRRLWFRITPPLSS